MGLKKLCAIAGEMKGKALSTELMQKLFSDMAEHYAPTIDCSSVASNAKYGYALTNVPLAECASKAAAQWEGYEVNGFSCDDIAPVAGSKGRQLIWSITSHITTPGGERVSEQIVNSYAFDDAGKIVATDQTFDTGLFSGSGAAANAVSLAAEQPQWQAFPLIAFSMGCIAGLAMMLGAMRCLRQRPPPLLEGYQECDA
eukprot:NODE_3648_length_760_cov_176.104965.p1 GENE.NODE_3648_length_760_cov_176.104965~~NODE_3648_length_760_cov_176.104965.p1  ORF type:complete len:199 (-),score=51.21 NODE_3648_length_760_cov_176.104965:146-742(-)